MTTVPGSKLDTSIALGSGTHNTVVQSWDKCGSTAKAAVPVTVNCIVEPRVPDDGFIDVSVGGADWARAPVAVVRRTQNKSKLLEPRWLSRTRQPVLARPEKNTQIPFIPAHWTADGTTTAAVMKVPDANPPIPLNYKGLKAGR